MATFFELKHRVDNLMKESALLAEKLGFGINAQNIWEQIEIFRKKELMVVAVGEAKKGKSSLLNALLNEKIPLFPVEINVCTNVVTIVRYGDTERIEVYIEDSKNAKGYRIETIRREQIPDFVSEMGNPNNYRQVKMLKASIPNELLKKGVVFVDTPGVGSLNIEHAEVTYGFLPNADMLLFVSDTASGLTESELNFLKRGFQYCKNILFPLTKKDLNLNFKVILEDNRRKIATALKLSEEDIQMIPVSSTAKIRYLSTGSKMMYQNSNLGGFVGFCFGGSAGAYLGAELGVKFGGVLGSAKGCIDSLGKYDALDVNEVSKVLTQYVTSSMYDVGGVINNTLV